jgi:rubrerythrin
VIEKRAPATHPEETIANLLAAHENGQLAKARYVAFAGAALREGYVPVAVLFRAAARAEQVQARSFADALRGLGRFARIVEPQVAAGETASNLRAAIESVRSEVNSFCPRAIESARHEHCFAALSAFRLALTARRSHAQLFTDAAAHLAGHDWSFRQYVVCQICGFTAGGDIPGSCPSCESPGDESEVQD